MTEIGITELLLTATKATGQVRELERGVIQAAREIRRLEKRVTAQQTVITEMLVLYPSNHILEEITPDEAIHVRKVAADPCTVADVYRWRKVYEL